MNVDELYAEVETAFRDVENDNPDVEAGWETDVARSVLAMSEGSAADKDEVFRMFFGARR